MNNANFINAHPELAAEVSHKHGGLDWINKYTNEVNGKVTEAWERDDKGELVNVTEKKAAERELELTIRKLRSLVTGEELNRILTELGICERI